MQPKSPPNPGRRKFLISATSAVGAVGVAGAVVPFISAFNPSAAAEAAGAPAVADIGKLAPGEMIIVEWRGTPIYVVKHSDESIQEIDKNLERLADPNSETQVQPDYAKNKSRILDKSDVVDSTFVTTHPSAINFKIKNSYYLPNPCDESFETLKNYDHNCEKDVFFGMSHGVHRGKLKPGKFDDREVFINSLVKNCKNIK